MNRKKKLSKEDYRHITIYNASLIESEMEWNKWIGKLNTI